MGIFSWKFCNDILGGRFLQVKFLHLRHFDGGFLKKWLLS